jgi:hypothetical protein
VLNCPRCGCVVLPDELSDQSASEHDEQPLYFCECNGCCSQLTVSAVSKFSPVKIEAVAGTGERWEVEGVMVWGRHAAAKRLLKLAKEWLKKEPCERAFYAECDSDEGDDETKQMSVTVRSWRFKPVNGIDDRD